MMLPHCIAPVSRQAGPDGCSRPALSVYNNSVKASQRLSLMLIKVCKALAVAL